MLELKFRLLKKKKKLENFGQCLSKFINRYPCCILFLNFQLKNEISFTYIKVCRMKIVAVKT